MEKTSRPFVGLATNWRSSVFFRARIKLTALYVVVMAVVLAVFSVTLFFNLSSDIKESVGHSLREGIDPDRFF